ncbi:MAG TPA: hypothetical protein VLH19_00065 [Patescibacteria group bacterium]|nr:hypothetical protein [Patescibacteria group bacterium]
MRKALLFLIVLVVMSAKTVYAQTATTISAPVPPPPNLNTYSVSFEADPIRKWWPTAPNSVQQIDAALWKDSDGTLVQNFSNVSAVWQVDPNFLTITDTSSNYFAVCPVVTAGGRPCIHFAAHVITQGLGSTAIKLTITDPRTRQVAWNQYPLVIYNINPSAYPSSTPYLIVTTAPNYTATPKPTFIPENKVSTEEFKKVQQRVEYLENQVQTQQQQLSQTQSLVQKILSFLQQIFHF